MEHVLAVLIGLAIIGACIGIFMISPDKATWGIIIILLVFAALIGAYLIGSITLDVVFHIHTLNWKGRL